MLGHVLGLWCDEICQCVKKIERFACKEVEKYGLGFESGGCAGFFFHYLSI
jgi:hypothetical protein